MSKQQTTVKLQGPRIEAYGPCTAAGLSMRVTSATTHEVPALWQKFGPHMGHVPGQRPNRGSLGICSDFGADRGFLYTAAVELADDAGLPADLTHIKLARATYAVFFVEDHISLCGAAWAHIFARALPEAGLKVAMTPQFEFYDQRFDPITGLGGYEIWIPIEA